VLSNLINQHQPKEENIAVTFKCPQESYSKILQKAASLNITVEKFIQNAVSYYLTFYRYQEQIKSEDEKKEILGLNTNTDTSKSNNDNVGLEDPLNLLNPDFKKDKRGRGRPRNENKLNKTEQKEIKLNDDKYFNVEDLVKYLQYRLDKIGKKSYRLNKQLIYRLVRQYLLPNSRIGITIMFKKIEIDAWFEDKGARYLYSDSLISLPKAKKYKKESVIESTDEILDLNELVDYLPSHPSKEAVYYWIKNNTIPYIKSTVGKIHFSKNEIDRWIQKGKNKLKRKKLKEVEVRETISNKFEPISEPIFPNVSRTFAIPLNGSFPSGDSINTSNSAENSDNDRKSLEHIITEADKLGIPLNQYLRNIIENENS
jgi:predicted DNA-binding transcriptional regulator AlpA